VELGYSEGDYVEVISGVAENEPVVVVGQDGLSEGTPIRVLAPAGEAPARGAGEDLEDGSPSRPGSGAPAPGDGKAIIGGQGGLVDGRFDPAAATPEQLERMKQLMRARGLSEEEIEERLGRARERAGTPAP
jgi:hypothetical protein